VTTAAALPHEPGSLNQRVAVLITDSIGSMWAAYAFAALTLISLPAAIASGSAIVIVAWIAQTFLQLVLLPVIIVGQNVQAGHADARAEIDHETLGHTIEILAGQDRELALQTEILRRLDAVHSAGGTA
jgi:hypothetical protein